MNFLKKVSRLLVAAVCLFPALAGAAAPINGNLDVRGNIVGGSPTLADTNLTISLASGTLTVKCIGPTGSSATCSASNPGWITINDTTAGQRKTYKITSSITFDDAANGTDSDFTGTGTCSWGTTAAVAWGNNLPLLLGIMSDGTTPVFVLARGPVLTSGASTNIGYKDVCPSSADQANVIALTSTNVTTTHANQTITWLGAVRATKNSSDNWTFATLDGGDGIGTFYNFGTREFDMPVGQNGATASLYFKANGGTAAQFTTNVYKFSIGMNGVTFLTFYFDGDGGTDGVGAVVTLLATPYAIFNNAQPDRYEGAVYIKWNNSANAQIGQTYLGATSPYGVAFRRNNSTSQVLDVQNADLAAGGRSLIGTLLYRAY